MKRIVSVALLVCLAGCGGGNSVSTPTTTAAPVTPACQTNNTASVQFGNRSANTTQDIFWDNLKITTLTPNQTSAPLTSAAGVAHRLDFRITNTSLFACQTSNPIPDRCGTPVYTCSFP